MSKTKFEAFLTKKLPANFETAMLLSIVRDKKIKNIARLTNYLRNETEFCRKWLLENRSATLGGARRRICTQKLEQFNKINAMLEKAFIGKQPGKRWKKSTKSWVGAKG